MHKHRIGDTLCVRWPFFDNEGQPVDLRDMDLELEIKSPIGGATKMPFDIVGDSYNTIQFRWEGVEQHHTGKYNFTLYINRGKQDQRVIDACTPDEPYPLQLVSCTHKTM